MTNLSSLYTNINNLVKGYEKQNGSAGASSNTIFTLTNAYVKGNNTLLVFVNGQKVEKVTSASDTTEYEETNNYTVTFGASLQDADVVEFYIISPYNLSQDNFDTMMGSYQESVGGIGGFKNKIINGGFDIWQRGGGTGDHTSSGDYSADRWISLYSGAMVLNPYQSTGTPTYSESGRVNTYTMRVNVNTADTSIAATDYAVIGQKIEGYNIVDLIGKVCTLSFWARAVTTGTYCIVFKNSGNDRSYVAEYTINSTTTWEYKTITFTMDDGLSGTWDFTNGVGLQIYFVMASGSTYQTTPGSWQSGNYVATSNQVNGVATTGDHLRLAMVQLEVGSSATSFESRSITQEVGMCSRYYYRATDGHVGVGAGVNSSLVRAGWSHPVAMRANAAITGSGNFRIGVNASHYMSMAAANQSNPLGVTLGFDSPSGFTPAADEGYVIDMGLSGVQYIEFDAEL